MRQKQVRGFQTGDMMKAIVTKGKKIGVYPGREAVRASGYFRARPLSFLYAEASSGWLWIFVHQDSIGERSSGHGAGRACRAIPPRSEGRGFPRKWMNVFAKNLLAFLRGLRRLNFSLTPEDLHILIEALERIGTLDRQTFFDVMRALWTKNHDEWRLFQVAFREWQQLLQNPDPTPVAFDTYLAQVAHRRRQEATLLGMSWLNASAADSQDEAIALKVAQGASRQEVLLHQRIDRLTEEEVQTLMKLHRAMRPLRTLSYRTYPGRKGLYWSARDTMRLGREGSEWLRFYYFERRQEPLPVVLVMDMSGSMSGYHRPLLQFVHQMMRIERRMEVFAFSTRLTRLTRALKYFHVDRALAEVAAKTPDRGGGTRIADSLEQLWQEGRGRFLGSRSALVIVSDGMEDGDGEHITEVLEKIRRSIQGRLHWWNPFGTLSGDSLKTPSLRVLRQYAAMRSVQNWQELLGAWSALAEEGPIDGRK